jgi:hypothetical protein
MIRAEAYLLPSIYRPFRFDLFFSVGFRGRVKEGGGR